jgi:DNA-binding transcriptional LysR family regulator
VDLRHLRYFVVVAEECHFGRAAERLHMAQPPLSRTIKQLESELGFELLDRTTRAVSLTHAGAAFLEEAYEILKAMSTVGSRALRVAQGREGQLSVGCVGSATYSLLPQFARAMRGRLPLVDVSFRGEMLTPDLLAGVRDATLDLALTRPSVDTGDDLVSTALRDDRLLMTVPADHHLARRTSVRIDDLRGETLIAHEGGGGSAMRRLVADLCDQAGFQAQVGHEVAETSTLLTFVAAGLGVAVVPETTALLGVPGVAHVPLANVPLVPLVALVRNEPNLIVDQAVAIVQTIVSRAGRAETEDTMPKSANALNDSDR